MNAPVRTMGPLRGQSTRALWLALCIAGFASLACSEPVRRSCVHAQRTPTIEAAYPHHMLLADRLTELTALAEGRHEAWNESATKRDIAARLRSDNPEETVVATELRLRAHAVTIYLRQDEAPTLFDGAPRMPPSASGLGRTLRLIEARYDDDDWARFDAGPGAIVAAEHARLERALNTVAKHDPIVGAHMGHAVSRWLSAQPLAL